HSGVGTLADEPGPDVAAHHVREVHLAGRVGAGEVEAGHPAQGAAATVAAHEVPGREHPAGTVPGGHGDPGTGRLDVDDLVPAQDLGAELDRPGLQGPFDPVLRYPA